MDQPDLDWLSFPWIFFGVCLDQMSLNFLLLMLISWVRFKDSSASFLIGPSLRKLFEYVGAGGGDVCFVKVADLNAGIVFLFWFSDVCLDAATVYAGQGGLSW